MQKSPDPGGSSHDNELERVAAVSRTDAWAVGYYATGVNAEQTLVEHWNGKAWKVQKSPDPGGASDGNYLYGVAATSSNSAWAVGYFGKGSVAQTLIEHWNGKAWKVQKSPDPGGASNDNYLDGVAATSRTNAWAVGYYVNGTAYRTLIEHWNGKAWKVQKSPNPGAPAYEAPSLAGVAAASSTNAWAVGYYDKGTAQLALVEHWNGKAWKVQKSSSDANAAYAVAAISATDAWAVGFGSNAVATRTRVEHWNGRAWTVQKSPSLGGSRDFNFLEGVAATSAKNAWAVGTYDNPKGTVGRNLIERWNGKAWRVQKSPNPGLPNNGNGLFGVAATSPTNAWAVGTYYNGTAHQTLVEHSG